MQLYKCYIFPNIMLNVGLLALLGTWQASIAAQFQDITREAAFQAIRPLSSIVISGIKGPQTSRQLFRAYFLRLGKKSDVM